ncbi:glycosyltransferase [candidate division WOR-3 bacterium]|nr:glycosyltransferase [candidate division WOR-3 bacterium]
MATRICILTSGHQVTDTRIFHRQARTLLRAGYQVLLAGIKDGSAHLPGYEPTFSSNSATHLRHHHPPLTIYTLPPSRSRLTRFTLTPLRLLLFALKAKADLYHLHDPELLPLALLLKALNRRVVCDIHEDYYRQLLDKPYLPKLCRQPLASLFNAYQKLVARHIDAVITATDTIASRLRTSARRLVTVKNYPEPLAVSRSEPQNGGKTPSTRPFRIVHLARVLTPERGITLLLEALIQLPDCELLLAGKFVSPDYEAKIKAHPAYPRVRHLGTLPHPDCFRWYTESDVGVVPSLPVLGYESALPVKMFEFMSAGLPVVVPDFPPLRAIVQECACGLTFSPGDATSLARVLATLKSQPDQARKMGKNGRDAVNKIYNWQNEEKKLLKLYEWII